MKRTLFAKLFHWIGNKTPEALRALRGWMVRHFIASCGAGVSIGRKSFIHKHVTLGDGSGVGYGCHLNGPVHVGNNVMMGPWVLVYTQNHRLDRTDIPMRQQGMGDIRPVTIEDDVWIGARVILLPGDTVGKGSVIGAGAVVSRDIPPYSVAVGNPCRVVRTRKQEDTI